jgi:hypothetical protein
MAIEPLFRDSLAAQVFDKQDIVSRGIMPLAVVIFNDNDFAVGIDGSTIELTMGDERIRTSAPEQFLPVLFKKTGGKFPLPVPIPRGASEPFPAEALEDFDHKFLSAKTIGPHQVGGGFIYLRVPQTRDLTSQLSEATLYIPEIRREDTGANLMFFEIDLKPALQAAPAPGK